MKKKTYIKLMAATVLASTLLLGACGNKNETTQTSSSAKTSQSSSSKAASSSKESKTQKSSSSASSEKSQASSGQSSTTADQSQAKPAPESRQEQAAPSQQAPSQAPSTQQGSQAQSNQSNYDPTTDRKLQDKQAEHNKRYKGVLTMVDGDFSAAAGNWKGSEWRNDYGFIRRAIHSRNLQMERKKTILSEATLTLLMMASIMPKSVEEKSSKLQQVRMVKFQALP